MECKKCGKEIVGEIQRYCNECKQNPMEQNINQKVEVKKASEENKVIDKKVKKEKKRRVFSFGFILFVIFMMALTFLASCVVGFAIGPILPI